MSKDKVLQFHFPQEERAHLFINGIKNIGIFEHITVFSPFYVFLEPQKYKVYADCRLYSYSSPLTPTPNLSRQTVLNRLQTRGERLNLNTFSNHSRSGCQQGKKPLAAKKGFPMWFSGKESACQCRIRRCGFDPWQGAQGWGERSPAVGNGNILQYSCLGNSMAGCSPQGHKKSDTISNWARVLAEKALLFSSSPTFFNFLPLLIFFLSLQRAQWYFLKFLLVLSVS